MQFLSFSNTTLILNIKPGNNSVYAGTYLITYLIDNLIGSTNTFTTKLEIKEGIPFAGVVIAVEPISNNTAPVEEKQNDAIKQET